MKRVLIVSTSFDEQKKIEEVAQYHNPGGLSVETTGSFAQDITYWTMQPPDVLVLNLPDDPLLQGYFFTKLRKDVPAQQPIVFLCSAISQSLMQLSMHYSKIRMLKLPVEAMALYKAVTDLMIDFNSGGRKVHPRYLTDQVAEIYSEFNEHRYQGVIKNMSLSGAYFEVADDTILINAGDFIKLSVSVGEPLKSHVLDVRVVWSKKQESGATGFGVTFVNKEDVYNHLLKHM